MMEIKKKLINGIPNETISYDDEWTEEQKAAYEKNLNQLAESFLCQFTPPSPAQAARKP